jgi:hypothetical protein
VRLSDDNVQSILRRARGEESEEVLKKATMGGSVNGIPERWARFAGIYRGEVEVAAAFLRRSTHRGPKGTGDQVKL